MNFDDVSELPGVYLWKDVNNNVIYVGKAKNLKKRMNQYFLGVINSFKTTLMVEKIKSYETIICHNENEALILERNLIQKYKPFYNVCLLDDKKYPFINIYLNKNVLHIDLKYSVRNENKYNLFYGPYLNNGNTKIILNYLKRKCFFETGLLIKNREASFWEKQFLLAKNILSKKNHLLIKELKAEMFLASEKEQFEIANDLKKVINFLNYQKEVQVVDLKENENLDVIAGIIYNNYLFLCIQFYRNGFLINSDNHVVEINISEDDTIRQFLNQFYRNKQHPIKIITNLDINNIFFSTQIINPKKGKYDTILNLCLKNIDKNKEFKILEYQNRKQIIIDGLAFLENELNIKNSNNIIMIDNSTTKNKNPISVIVAFQNGLPNHNEYRKFNIDSTNRIGDVEYLKQGLEKYFKNILELPNLLIVDGGIQQINEAIKVMKSMDIKNLQIIGLIKNDHHKTEYAVTANGIKIKLKNNPLLFLSNIQEEVDRFAKVFHKSKNFKSSLEGKLLNIDGIGTKTELKILEHFENYNNIYNADLKELEKVVSKKIALKIFENLKK